MRIFKSSKFAKFAYKNGLSDNTLKTAIAELEAGNFDTDLGGYVYKQRIARKGQGERGGYRTIILFKQKERALFALGFAKNEQSNITDKELFGFKKIAKNFMRLTDIELTNRCRIGSLVEII